MQAQPVQQAAGEYRTVAARRAAGVRAENLPVLLSKRLPLSCLITLCHMLRHNLAAGLSLARVFRQQAEKGPPLVRPIAARMSAKLEKGKDLESALLAIGEVAGAIMRAIDRQQPQVYVPWVCGPMLAPMGAGASLALQF